MSRLVLVEPRQHARHGRRATEAATRAPNEIHELLPHARPPSVGGGPFVCRQSQIALSANDRHLSKRGVADVQGQVGAGGLEDGQRLLDEGIQLRGLALRLEVHAYLGRLDPPAELSNLVACGRGAVRERIGAPERLVDLACPEQDLDELGFEGEVELGRRHERGCALEEARRRPVVLA